MKFNKILRVSSLMFLGLEALSVRGQIIDSGAPADQREGAKPTIVIATTNNPPGAGTVTGGGSKTAGSAYTLTAEANATVKAVFLDWTVNGVVVSSKTPYTFTPTTNETVVANFGYGVTTSSEPAAGGTTGGAGAYTNGQNVTVTATPNACYDFTGWTKTGRVGTLSTDPSYNFTIGAGEAFVANFQLKEDVIGTESNPPHSGSTTGGGNKSCGTKVTVTAKPAAGYKFNGWTVGATPVSMANPYSFEAEGTETLTANFADISAPTVAFTSPKASESVASSVLTITGTANNVLGVSAVGLTVNGVPFTVTSANNWSNWTANVLLKAGANVIDADALSQAGNPSKTATITVTDTKIGLAPAALAGFVGQVGQGTNAPFEVSFGTATFEQFSTDTNQGSAVGNYTYTQTGPDTATLALADFVPPALPGQGNSEVYLTFTNPVTATFTDQSGHTGFITLATGLGLDVSSLSGWTIVERPGTAVTGNIHYPPNVLNAFDPASGAVPPGFANSSSPTVTLQDGDNVFRTGIPGDDTFTAVDFNGDTLTVTQNDFIYGASPYIMTFTDPAFTGISKISDDFINGGINASLNGDVMTLVWNGSYAPNYVLIGNYTATFDVSFSTPAPDFTTTFGDGKFTRTDSNGTNTQGTYTSMQYGPMATMVVETNADPYVGGIEFDYTMFVFTSPGHGNFFITHYDGAGDPPTYVSGTFDGTYQASGLTYIAPATLNGRSSIVTQKTPQAEASFNVTFGQATMAQTTDTTNNKSRVSNYLYTRTGANTAILKILDYLPASGAGGGGNNGSPISLTFSTPTTATYDDPSGPSTGTIEGTVLPQTGYFAPAALAQATITGTSDGGAGTAMLNYGSYTNITNGKYGTYTYAQFSPTVGMLVTTSQVPASAGDVSYYQLTFNSASGGSSPGDFYNTKTGGTVAIGTFKFSP